jgi:predicted CoA-binding protein
MNMKTKKTVVIGASTNPDRYAFRAVNALTRKGHPVEAVGLRGGFIGDVEIHTDRPLFKDIDTVTLYVGPRHMDAWKQYVESLNPNRVIFNPGTEDPAWAAELNKMGIETTDSCTLVRLSVGNY